MQIGENIAVVSPDNPGECSTCSKSTFEGYKTKHGKLKQERTLEKNLRKSDIVSNDPTVGTVYPLDGGNDPTKGWRAKEGVFEDFKVDMAAAPHHLIPGKAAMAESNLEKWTCASKGKIKEDIGYNIDCAQNGIFLPHLPEIYWTKHKEGIPMAKFYGQTWSGLSGSSKESISFVVMQETWLQIHYTDHDDPYEEMSPYASYDQECIDLCDELGNDITKRMKDSICPECGRKPKEYDPPYEVVNEINQISKKLKNRITGKPTRWRSWVSPLAKQFTKDLLAKKIRLLSRTIIEQKI